MTPKRILLLSAYDARSHRYWRRQLVQQFPQHHWQILNLKDRFFAWRMGGNALNFKAQYDELLQANYDLLLATSMTDLSTLRGMYPHLSHPPNLLYFHENQFAYPPNQHQQGLKEIQLRSIFAATVADQLMFNSTFNRDSFLTGVADFVQQMPDGIPPDVVHGLANKATVLAVPLAADCLTKPKTKTDENIQVVWNHRWEHDKGPETLLALLRLCQQHNAPIKFHIIGQQFRQTPKAFATIMQQHSDQCLNLGFIESRPQYLDVLQASDVALSTALHDFQGISLLEAAACGCLPLAPNRLVYPELYPSTNLYPSTPDEPKQEAQAIYEKLTGLDQLVQPEIRCQWPHVQAGYERWINH